MKDFKYFTIFVSIILVLSFSQGCGKKGDLKLEPQILPPVIKNMMVTQIDRNINIKWSFPEFLSDDSTALNPEKINTIYIYYAKGDISLDKFRKKSSVLRKTDLSSLKKDNDLLEMNIPFRVKDLSNKNYYFSLRYRYGKKKSQLSNIVKINTKIPVIPIKDLSAFMESKTVVLKWTRPKKDINNNGITELSGYDIFRKVVPAQPDETSPVFKKINREKLVNSHFEDTDTGENGTYFYYVSVILSENVFSDKSNIVKIRVKDLFPPEIPSNVTVFKAKDHLFISWGKVSDSDLAYYRIYRKTGKKNDFKLIGDKITETNFKDKNVKSGTEYFYTVTSVDNNGNESDNSNVSSEIF